MKALYVVKGIGGGVSGQLFTYDVNIPITTLIIYADKLVFVDFPKPMTFKINEITSLNTLSYFPYFRKGGIKLNLSNGESYKFWSKDSKLVNKLNEVGILIKK